VVKLDGGREEGNSQGQGKGSEFVVRLPLAPDKRVAAEAERSPPVPPAAPLAGRRILVVDDNSDAANSLSTLLKLMGNQVQTAYDGPGALKIAAEQKPEVILVDISMPVMNGYEVVQRLRQIPDLEKSLVVALTGYGAESDVRRSRESGFDAHLLKPVDIERLQSIVNQRDQ